MMQIQISASEKEGLEQALGNMKDVQASILQVQPADADLKATTQPKIACKFLFCVFGISSLASYLRVACFCRCSQLHSFARTIILL
jgi:hypothetical protein